MRHLPPLTGSRHFMHSKRMATPPASPAPKVPTSKGAAIVAKNRAKLNALTDDQREHYFNRGMQLIYGGSAPKAKVGRG